MRVAKLYNVLTDFIKEKRKLKKVCSFASKICKLLYQVFLLLIMMLCPLELVNLSLLL